MGKHDLFLKQKIVDIIITLKGMEQKKYNSSIIRKANCTYAHGTIIMKKLEENGFVQIHKNGRTNNVRLTKKGHETAEHLIKIRETIS